MSAPAKLTAAALLLPLLAGIALADEDARPGAGRGELYLKVSTGLGLTRDSDLEIRQADPAGNTGLTFFDVSWEDNSLSGPSARYTTVRVGYFFKEKPWLGLAVEFMHFKVFAEVDRMVRVQGTNVGVPIDTSQPMSAIVERYVIGNGVNFIPVTVIARKRLKQSERFPHGRLQPYGGFGLGPTLLYTQSTVNGKRRGGPYELGSVGIQALGGLQFHLSRSWDLFAEYKYTFTQANGSIDDGSSRTDLFTDHFTAGVGVHF
jgi:hypothetical protein